MNFIRFKSLANTFFDQLSSTMADHQVFIEPHWHIDHLCYRTHCLQEYQQLKSEFSSFATLLIESKVGGRPISTFKLHEPLHLGPHQIDLVELPAPKSQQKKLHGFEHIEVVIDIEFSDIKSKYSHLTFSESGLKKPFNQELSLLLPPYAIKFHHISLESVVNFEKQKSLFEAVRDCQVLESLKNYSPLIAGTYPLDLQKKTSDIDVLLSADDLPKLSLKLKDLYSHLEDFDCYFGQQEGLDYLVANFTYMSFSFELFAQNISSVSQRAYRHFLIEERILKIGGQKMKNKILKLRSMGLKTEPAFAEALQLEGDPYLQLLKLQLMTEAHLRSLIQQKGILYEPAR